MKKWFYLSLLACSAGCSTPAINPCIPECATGFVCKEGTCVPGGEGPDAGGADASVAVCEPACGGLTPYCNGSHHCVGCTMDAQCPPGKFCKVVSDAIANCAVGCQSDDRCGGGKCCNNTCADTSTDPANCGGCGTTCAAAHAQVRCVNGQCAQATCDPGWGDCDGNPQNGCEANLHADPNNCTACGAACNLANAVNGCADGCYVQACNFGFDDCNGDSKDGCELSVLTDKNNCGACGKPCNALPNATANCTNGNCVLGQCNMGFENCDGNPANGCEADLQRDAKNCNGCGVACAQGLYCVMGKCQMGCLMGMGPPLACDTGTDMHTGKKWVVCEADCQHAWLAQADMAGGSYHALEICKSLGYSQFGMWDGDCGTVCGYCEQNVSCKMPGKKMFSRSPMAPNCGSDQFGPIICNTVQWLCMP